MPWTMPAVRHTISAVAPNGANPFAPNSMNFKGRVFPQLHVASFCDEIARKKGTAGSTQERFSEGPIDRLRSV